jgi:large subunit ribosomal protein L18
MLEKTKKRLRRKLRVRAKINGTSIKPRLSVFRSNAQIYVQLIDDTTSKTLASVSDLKIKEK